jgi:hypothetical protein
MLYQKRVVKAPAMGMTREAAAESLSKQFTKDTEILELKRRGDKWVATLLEPHTAEFPPGAGGPPDEEAGPPTDGPPKAEKSESGDGDKDSKGSPDDKKGDGPPEGDKGPSGEMAMVMDLLSAIADKLGIVPGMAPGAADGPVPGEAPPPPPGPPAPPMGGPPMGGPPGMGAGPHGAGKQEIIHKTKLKPGDTPPGVTPIGAPAFSSVDTAQLQRMASFDAFDDTPNKSIKQAKDELEAIYGPHGFKVRQIKRVEGGTRLAAKLSRR